MGRFDNDKNGQCFACGRKLGKNPLLVETIDHQTVYVGSECAKHVRKAEDGWQPPKGGPRLFLLCETAGASCASVGLQHV